MFKFSTCCTGLAPFILIFLIIKIFCKWYEALGAGRLGVGIPLGRDFQRISRRYLEPKQPPVKGLPALIHGGNAAGAWP
jgi:hypothetical protein